jgi:hypothetical protein
LLQEDKELRTNALIMGILLIIGGVVDYAVTPQIINKVNTLTSSLERGFLPSMDNSGVSSAHVLGLTEISSKVTQLSSVFRMVEKVSEYSSWATVIAGMGTVVYGVFAKGSRIQKNKASQYNSVAFEILKIRLAKGDITREDFNKLKNDLARS